jgi:hypothetical protein
MDGSPVHDSTERFVKRLFSSIGHVDERDSNPNRQLTREWLWSGQEQTPSPDLLVKEISITNFVDKLEIFN